MRDSDVNNVVARSSAVNQPSGAQACSGGSCQGGTASFRAQARRRERGTLIQCKVTGRAGDTGSGGSRVAIETERAGPAGVGAEGTRPQANLVATFWGPLKDPGSGSSRGVLGDPEEPHPRRQRADLSGKRDPYAVTRKPPGDAQTIFK